ncbi:hypothetical protein F5877DRAFT_81073 [Lentinula edodes]|nr:hypothetical protein F5877DRAFT_81073 [Lentinula edodes]
MGSMRKSSRSKIAGHRMVQYPRLSSRTHPMILRRASAQSSSAYTTTATPHATPMSDPAPITADVPFMSNPAPTTFHEAAPMSDVISASLPTNRPDLVFAKEACDYMKRSTEILQTQTENLILLNQKLASLNEDKEVQFVQLSVLRIMLRRMILGTRMFFFVVTPSVLSVSANIKLRMFRNDPKIRIQSRSSFAAQPAMPSFFVGLNSLTLYGKVSKTLQNIFDESFLRRDNSSGLTN